MNWITNSVLPKIKALVQSNDVPDNLWVKCPSCNQMLFHQEYEQAFHCCTTCGHHAPLPPELRFKLLFDGDNYQQLELDVSADDPLKFKDSKRYPERLKATRAKTGTQDAIAVATGTIQSIKTVVATFDFRFMGGSMGRTVGDGLLKAAKTAVAEKAALIVVPSSGGARMQEGILSLMQLPRSIIAVEQLKSAGLPYIVLLTHPTTGGVTASFAMLGDILLIGTTGAESNSVSNAGTVLGFDVSSTPGCPSDVVMTGEVDDADVLERPVGRLVREEGRAGQVRQEQVFF